MNARPFLPLPLRERTRRGGRSPSEAGEGTARPEKNSRPYAAALKGAFLVETAPPFMMAEKDARP